MIRTAPALTALLPELRGASRIAMDTEFHSERWYFPRLMLLQLRADDREPVLIDPLAISLAPLAEPLRDRPIVVHGGQQDAQILYRLLGITPNIVFDTQIAAGLVGAGYPIRLQELTRRYTGVQMDKGETMSDWSRRPLTDSQAGYAAEDVQVLGALVDALREEVERHGRTAAMDSAVSEMLASVRAEPDDDNAWRRVGGAQLLDDSERACLRALTAWRDREARVRDVPKNMLASDGSLLDLARRRPETAQEIRANRRMPGHLSRQEAEAVLGLLAEPGPPPPRLPRDRAGFDAIRAASRADERRTGVAAELLLPDGEIHRVLDRRSVASWRKNLMTSELSAFIDGNSSFTLPALAGEHTIS